MSLTCSHFEVGPKNLSTSQFSSLENKLLPEQQLGKPLFISSTTTHSLPTNIVVLNDKFCVYSVYKGRLILIKYHGCHFYYPTLQHVKNNLQSI